LLGWSLAEAARRGVEVLRVDCYAGGDGRLVRYRNRRQCSGLQAGGETDQPA
jgi:hypothetical protein